MFGIVAACCIAIAVVAATAYVHEANARHRARLTKAERDDLDRAVQDELRGYSGWDA